MVFTHLQAAYDTEEQYRDIRKSQVSEIRDLVADVLGPGPENWQNVIVAGDLNIRGDVDATSNEWFDIFDEPSDPFGELFADSWIEMRPPGVTQDVDPGLTNRNRETQAEQRLDYICRFKTIDGFDLLAHHMRIGHRDTSDHYALEALIQVRDDHCQPLGGRHRCVGPVAGAPDPTQPRTSAAYVVQADINVEGGRSWVWVRRPGTYTFHHSPRLVMEVFAADDISRPLTRLDSLSVTDVPRMPRSPTASSAAGSTEGSTYVNRSPLLVCLRAKDGDTATGCSSCSSTSVTRRRPRLRCRRTTSSRCRSRRTNASATTTSRGSGSPAATLMGTARQETVYCQQPDGSGTMNVYDVSLSPLGNPTSGSNLAHVLRGRRRRALRDRACDSDADIGEAHPWSTRR